MAKSRAQRKAEKRRREQAQQQGGQSGRPAQERSDEERAQHDTQTGASGDMAEFEAVMETGADTADYGEHVTAQPDDPESEAAAKEVAAEARTPDAPAPSRADVGKAGDGPAGLESPAKPTREQRRAAKAQEKEARKRERQRELQKAQAEKAEKRRGGVIGFFASCIAELKKVQWPDRDTLVQASAVTLIFVVVLAAYLGGLDAVFNYIVKNVLL